MSEPEKNAGIVRPLSRLASPAIDDLAPSTVEGVADRLVLSSTFEELVSRESEMDALFTLVDLAIHAGRDSFAEVKVGVSDTAKIARSDLLTIRDLIFHAHDMSYDDQVAEGAALLRQAAELIAASR